MDIWSIWKWGVILALFVGTAVSSDSSLYLRCLGDILQQNPNSTSRELIHSLSQATCEACPTKKLEEPDSPEYHAMAFVTNDNPEFVALAAGLIQKSNVRVTILYVSPTVSNEDTSTTSPSFNTFQDKILASIPCDHPSRGRRTWNLMELKLPLGNGPKNQQDWDCLSSSLRPLEFCSIDAAFRTMQVLALQELAVDYKGLLLERPDVLVMDATLVGGLWLSEWWGIPTVALGSHHVLPLAVEHDPNWFGPDRGSWWARMSGILRQRIYSLSLTSAFWHLNKVRQSVGLRRLRSPLDYFGPVVALILEHAPEGAIPSTDANAIATAPSTLDLHWQRTHVLGSLQPPCTPCSPMSNISSEVEAGSGNPVILVSAPSDMTATWTRSLLQGLAMARASLHRYDECEWDSLSCQRPLGTDFNVVWLTKEGEPDYFPPIVPHYISRQSTMGLLDSVATNPTTIGALVPCDSEAELVERALGIMVVCLSETDRMPLRSDQIPPPPLQPRTIAAKLLQQLRRRQLDSHKRHKSSHDKPAMVPPFNGLERAVSLIEEVAVTHRAHQPWRSTQEMQTNISRAVSRRVHEWTGSDYEPEDDDTSQLQPYDTFTVLVAWVVILASIGYVVIKDSLSVRPSSSRGRAQFLSEGILARLPDLDDAWSTLLEWYKSQPEFGSFAATSEAGSSAPRPAASAPRSPVASNQGNNVPSQNHNPVRRRRRR